MSWDLDGSFFVMVLFSVAIPLMLLEVMSLR